MARPCKKHRVSSSASLSKPNAYKYNGGTELTKDFGWQMYDAPFRSYDPQLGRFHQADPLADKAPGINPYRFVFNNPIRLNDPTGLWEGSLADLMKQVWTRSHDNAVTIWRIRDNNRLERDLVAENKRDHFIKDFQNYGGTAEFMQDAGGGFWIDYDKPLLITGSLASQGDNTYKANFHAIQSKFVRLNGISGHEFDPDFMDYVALGIGGAGTYYGTIGDAFYSKHPWVQGNGKVRLSSTINNNFLLQRSNSITRSATQGARTLSATFGAAGTVISVANFVGTPSYANAFDVALGSTAFIPVIGWAISGTYFISNTTTTLATGKTIGKHIFGNKMVFGN